MAIPTFVAAGTTDTLSSGTSVSPGYPAGLAAGHLLILHTIARSATTVTVPSGWTSFSSDTQGTITEEVLYRIASGSETGSLTVNFSGSAVHTGRIYAINAGSTPTIESSLSAKGTSASLVPATVTTTGADRLAVAVVALLSGQVTTAIAGMSGGTWVEAATNSANDTPQLQTADKASSGTVSGGAQVVTNAHWIVRTFAVYDAGAPATKFRRGLSGVGI